MDKRRSQRNISFKRGDEPTKERRGQNGGIVKEAIHEKNASYIYTTRHRALFESALDAYLWHGLLTNPEYDAGQKFGREYARSVFKIRLYDYGAGSHGDKEMVALSAINSNTILREALKLLSTAQRDVVIRVCVENYRAGTGRKLKYFRKALQILACHWNMK